MRTCSLEGKVALVTGGGQGLGAAISRALAEAGAAVAVNYVEASDHDAGDHEAGDHDAGDHDAGKGKNRMQAEETARQLGSSAAICQADVRKLAETGAMLDWIVERFGKIDLVINNAGILRDRTLKKMSAEEWHQVIETNLTGVFNVCRSAVPLLSNGGRIVNLASIAGILGFFGQCNYAASKAGVIGFTKALSKELGYRGITVNAVAPGVVLTEMGRSIPEEVRDEMLKQIPLGRFGEPEEIADAVMFLCSDMAKYISGQVIQVNGGWIG
jgi:3-oxoacyl-[acyl-carrier protein] reductase